MTIARAASLPRRPLSEYVAAFALGAVAIGVVQGPAGPLAQLGGTLTFVLGGCGVVAAVIARVRSGSLATASITVGLAVMLSAALIVGELSAGAPPGQWAILLAYSLPFVLAALIPAQAGRLALTSVLAAGTVQIAAALTLGSYIPTISGVPQLSGGLQPNVLGLIAASVAVWGASIVFSGTTARVRMLGIAIAALGVIVVLLTVSRTGLLSLVVGLAALIATYVRKVVLLWIALVTAIAVLCAMALGLRLRLLEEWFVRGDMDSMGSLTGRTDIWALAGEYFLQRPILGWGFGSLYAPSHTAGAFLTQVRGTNAHSAAMQSLVEAGILGTVLAAVLILTLVVRVLVNKTTARPLLIGLLALLAFNAIGSAGIATVGYAAVLLAAMFAASRPHRIVDVAGHRAGHSVHPKKGKM